MTKKQKPAESEKRLTDTILDSAHQIWLAGLGAFYKAEEEGSKLFESLVKEGEAIEARRKKDMEKQTEEMRGKATEAWDRLEQVFQDRVARSLSRLGVATHEDLKELRTLVEELNGRIAALTKAQEATGEQAGKEQAGKE